MFYMGFAKEGLLYVVSYRMSSQSTRCRRATSWVGLL